MFHNNIVHCAQGALRGRAEGSVTAFLGVPFAAPPIGANRWRAPQEPAKWAGVRSAEFYRAGPMQVYGMMGDEREMGDLSEDCLYLNIWTSAGSAEDRHPVFVWFYGGAYQGGRADDPSFCGAELAKRGIVVVTVNYRVNVFGFLCHPDMRAESPYGTGGNFGFLDQVASLAWIRQNIAAFGGDPDAVTIAGQSAGSASVNNLMVSPLSRTLFHRAINQSGDVFQPERDIRFDQACEVGLRLCEHFGCANLDELRQVPAEKFIGRMFDLVGMELHTACTPVMDGVVFPYAQGNMLLRNDCMQIPILMGANTDEGSGGGPGYVQRVTERLGISAEPYADEMLLARDYWYSRHYAWARIRTEEHNLPTWFYVYNRADGDIGAQHGAEIPYIFRTLDRIEVGVRHTVPYTDEDYAFMERISSYWENFIKTGDPNGEGLPFWPKKNDSRGHMKLDLVCEMVDDDYIHENDPVICPAAYAWLKRRADGEIDG